MEWAGPRHGGRRQPRAHRRTALRLTICAATAGIGLLAVSVVTGWPVAVRSTASDQAAAALGREVVIQADEQVSKLNQGTQMGDGWLGLAANPAPSQRATATPAPRRQPGAGRTGQRDHSTARPTPQPTATATAYLNPLRAVSGLIPERIDMGVDFGGAGPVYPLGDAVITNATSDSPGWPGGGWITYQLTDGPGAGLQVYVAEDVTPTVEVGEHVTPTTVIANMYNGDDGIEIGWAMPDGASAESQLAVAGGIGGGGPFPTYVGLNFEQLLLALGAPTAANYGQAPNGLLPSNYPTDWATLLASG
jgi:hypothetical protein